MASSKSIKSPAFQFYPKDYLLDANVRRMSMTERGIYQTLMSICWLDGGLPTDLAELAREVAMPPKQFTRIWTNGALHLCFYERDGKFQHKRLDDERRKQAEFRRRQTDAAQKRWDSRGNATASTRHKGGNALRSPISDLQSADKRTPMRRGSLLSGPHPGHSLCGRICIPTVLFDEFVRRRNAINGVKDIEAWFKAVDDEWTTGAHKDDEPGDPFAFWRAQYEAKWPARPIAKPAPKNDGIVKASEHPYAALYR